MMDKNIFKLMFISVIMLFCGFTLIFLKQYPFVNEVKVSDFLYIPWLFAEIFLAFFIEILLIKCGNNINLWLFPCAFFLSDFGLLIIGRLEPSLIIPQIRWIILGMIAFFMVFRFEKWIRKILNYKYFWGILCLFVLLFTIIFGRDINGVSNCIAIGSIRLQPLEFAKIVFVFFLAFYLGNYELSKSENSFFRSFDIKLFSLVVVILSIAFLLFIAANDFGNALIFFFIALIMIHIKIEDKFLTIVSIILFFITAFIFYYMLTDVHNFFDAWLNPWTISSESERKILESFFAFGAGGIWGAGFTMGHPDFILDAYNNYIFSAVAEEFGLIGAVFLIMIYILLFYQSVAVTFKLKSEVEILLAFGVAVLFFLQTFLTILSVTNVLPITKTFIPFIGYGGSAIISNFILLGILVSLSRKEIFND